MDDDTRSVKEHAADVVIVLSVKFTVLTPGEDCIKYRVCIWEGTRLLGHCLDRSRIRTSGTTQIWVHDVVVTAISLAVLVFSSTVGERGML